MSKLSFNALSGGDDVPGRLDPRTKLVGACTLISVILLSTKAALPLAIAAFCLAQFVALGLPLKTVRYRLSLSMGMALTLAVLQIFMSGSTAFYSFSCFGVVLTATREGLRHGILLGSRAWGAGCVMLLFTSITPPHQIFRSLRWLRVPASWVDIVLLVHRYTFVLLGRAGDMVDAQKVRLGYSGVRNSLSSMGAVEGALLLGSIDQATGVFDSMRTRGYTGRMPLAAMPALSFADRLIMGAVPLAGLGLTLIVEKGFH